MCQRMEHNPAIPLGMSKLQPDKRWIAEVLAAYNAFPGRSGAKGRITDSIESDRKLPHRMKETPHDVSPQLMDAFREAINKEKRLTPEDEAWLPPPFVAVESRRHHQWCEIGARMQKVDILDEFLELMRQRVEDEERNQATKSKVSKALRKPSEKPSDRPDTTGHGDQPRGGRPAR